MIESFFKNLDFINRFQIPTAWGLKENNNKTFLSILFFQFIFYKSDWHKPTGILIYWSIFKLNHFNWTE